MDHFYPWYEYTPVLIGREREQIANVGSVRLSKLRSRPWAGCSPHDDSSTGTVFLSDAGD